MAVVLGLQMTEAFLMGKNLPIDADPPADSILGNHAVLAVGYDRSTQTISIKNSWGVGWADNGYAPITFNYFRQYARRMLRLTA
jgi:C1A family cysteine protease